MQPELDTPVNALQTIATICRQRPPERNGLVLLACAADRAIPRVWTTIPVRLRSSSAPSPFLRARRSARSSKCVCSVESGHVTTMPSGSRSSHPRSPIMVTRSGPRSHA